VTRFSKPPNTCFSRINSCVALFFLAASCEADSATATFTCQVETSSTPTYVTVTGPNPCSLEADTGTGSAWPRNPVDRDRRSILVAAAFNCNARNAPSFGFRYLVLSVLRALASHTQYGPLRWNRCIQNRPRTDRKPRFSKLASTCTLMSAGSSPFPYTHQVVHPRKCMKTRVHALRADYLVADEFNIIRPWLEARNEKHWKKRALFGRQFNSLPRLWNWGRNRECSRPSGQVSRLWFTFFNVVADGHSMLRLSDFFRFGLPSGFGRKRSIRRRGQPLPDPARANHGPT
jgi:hypothetical protein